VVNELESETQLENTSRIKEETITTIDRNDSKDDINLNKNDDSIQYWLYQFNQDYISQVEPHFIFCNF
jgi:hypothetical protein